MAQLSVEVELKRQPFFTKRSLLALGIFFSVLAFFLTQTRLPAVLRKLPVLDRGATGRNRSAFTQVLDPDSYRPAFRWVAYGVNLWDANAIGMLFAVLLGAAAMAAFSPAGRAMQFLQRQRGSLGAGMGGAMGLPLFMCSACSAPVSLGFLRAGASLETSLGLILGSALFNPVGIFAITYLMPLPLVGARIGFGLAAIFLMVPLIARRADACSVQPTGTSAGLPASAGPHHQETWGEAAVAVLKDWWNKTREMAFRLALPMAAAGFVVGGALTVAPPQQLSETLGSGVVAIVVAAALGTLLQLPTLFEIPLVVGALALGLGAGPAAALLVTAPSTGLVTLAITRRELGWRTPLLMLAGTFIGGTIAGLVVSAL